MKRCVAIPLTAVLLLLVALIYLGGLSFLRPVYDKLRHTRIWRDLKSSS